MRRETNLFRGWFVGPTIVAGLAVFLEGEIRNECGGENYIFCIVYSLMLDIGVTSIGIGQKSSLRHLQVRGD